MADDVSITEGSGDKVIAGDDIGGVIHQRVKLIHGADGTNDGDVSSVNGLPVELVAGTAEIGKLGAGTAEIGKLAAGVASIGVLGANSGVDIGDVDVTTLPSDTFVTEGGALGLGVLLQGDDGTDRKNINVDPTTGDVQVDVTNTVTVDATTSGDVPVTLAGEAVVLGAGTAEIGKLAAGVASIGVLGANSGVDIGDVDVLTLPSDTFVTEGGALGLGVLLQGDDGTDRKNINVDPTTGDVQVDVTNTVVVDATGQGDVPVTLAGEAVILGAGTAEIGKLAAGVASIGVLGANSGVDIGDVDVLTLPNVTLAAGTNTNEMVGDVADDAVAAGNPVQIGAIAKETDGTDPGSVSAEADVTSLTSDRNRRLLVNTRHANSFAATDNQATAQTDTALQAAPGSDLSLYITDVIISNGATAGNVKIVQDTAGTPIDILEVMYFAINGGAHLKLETPIRVTPNIDVGYTSVTVTTHSVTVLGYTAP